LYVQTCSCCNLIIRLMRRPNTDSAPNMPVMLVRKQLLIRYVITSPVHTVTIRCQGTRKRYKCVPTLTCSPDINAPPSSRRIGLQYACREFPLINRDAFRRSVQGGVKLWPVACQRQINATDNPRQECTLANPSPTRRSGERGYVTLCCVSWEIPRQ
jgi:hypothetical protein